MIYVDTVYLLAVVNPRDGLHSRALAWSRSTTERLLVTEYVLCEVVNALSKPIDRPKAHAIVKQFRTAKDCELVMASADLFEAGLQLHAQRTDKEWSLTDCISFVIMTRRGVRQALTSDHHFEQAGFEALLRRDPP